MNEVKKKKGWKTIKSRFILAEERNSEDNQKVGHMMIKNGRGEDSGGEQLEMVWDCKVNLNCGRVCTIKKQKDVSTDAREYYEQKSFCVCLYCPGIRIRSLNLQSWTALFNRV